MPDSFDEVELNTECPRCTSIIRKSARQLRDEPRFECSACGTPVNVNETATRCALANLDMIRAELDRLLMTA